MENKFVEKTIERAEQLNEEAIELMKESKVAIEELKRLFNVLD